MIYKKPSFIVIMAALFVMVLSFALITVWEGFSFVGVLAGSVVFATLTILARRRFKLYKRALREKRYTDAYVYAEEMGDLEMIHTFKYPKAVERQLKAGSRSRLLLYTAFLGAFIVCLALLVYIPTVY